MLRHCIPIEKLNWTRLSTNPNAVHLLEENPEKINGEALSSNPNAIHSLLPNKQNSYVHIITVLRRAMDDFSEFFNDVFPDEDGLYNGLVLPPKQYWFLWGISWISLGSGCFVMYRGYYDLAVIPLGVWLTSINYWRYPDYSWRRYLDIGYVHLGLLYQSIRAYGSEYSIAYYTFLAVGMIFFPISVYFHKKRPWISTILHSMVHIFGNISNVVLYSGDVINVRDSWFV